MSLEHLIPNYGRFPVEIVRGEGAWLFDRQDRALLDCTSGIGVTPLGHVHPVVTEAIRQQAGKLLHCSNLYRIPAQEALAEKLTAATGLDRAFFCNSGAEANEAAIKLARRYAQMNPDGTPKQSEGVQPRGDVITFYGGFHGRTLATVTATAQPQYQQGFAPLPEGFVYVPFNDLEAVAAAISSSTCAIMVEPVQGEGGVIPAAPGFLQGIRDLCDQHGLLLIIDEVQTGVGRTGPFLASQLDLASVKPDIVSMAKGLANGVPIGALLAREEVALSFGPGSHGSTFGGNPLASTAALATLEVVEKEGLGERALQLGARFRARLEEVVQRHEACKSVRGRGLMQGLVLDRPARDTVLACLDQGLLVTVAGGDTVRFLPPLIIDEDLLLDEAIRRLEKALDVAVGG